MIALLALAIALQPVPSPAPAPQPPPVPALTPAPQAQPQPQPGGTVSPAPSGAPTPSPTTSPAYHFIFTPQPAPSPNAGDPQILEVDMTDSTVHQNTDVAVRVKTTPGVIAVTVSTMGRSLPLYAAGPGDFRRTEHLPTVPFFMYSFLGRTYQVQFVASTQDGRSTSTTVPVRVDR